MGLTLATTTSEVLASAALLAAAAGVAGLGTYGAFTGTTNASAEVTAGIVSLTTIGDTSMKADGFVPGDSMQRAVTLQNTGNQDLSAISLSSVSTNTPAAKTALTGNGGLKVTVDSCPAAWAPVYGENRDATGALECKDGATSLVTNAKAVSTNLPLSNSSKPLPSHRQDGVSYLRVTLTLPATVTDNTMQGKTDGINLSFIAATRSGTLK